MQFHPVNYHIFNTSNEACAVSLGQPASDRQLLQTTLREEKEQKDQVHMIHRTLLEHFVILTVNVPQFIITEASFLSFIQKDSWVN